MIPENTKWIRIEMWGLLAIVTALIIGWIILSGFGELWYKILIRNKLEPNNTQKEQLNSPKERVITLCICRTLAAIPILLVVWSLEYAIGLGKNLTLLTPLLLIVSLWIYYSNWKKSDPIEKKTRIVLESGFLLSLVLGISIIWGNTDLIGGDKAADLYFTATMATGEVLPPTNPWLPPFKAEDYYRGQWYAGGLLARLCGLSLPQNYFVSYTLCIAWITYGILSCAWIITKHNIKLSFLVLFVCLFGSHFGPIVGYATVGAKCTPHEATTIVGDTLCSKQSNENQLTTLGYKIINISETEAKKMKPKASINEIPCQPYSYHTTTVEWHSWYGGYLILSIIAVALAGYILSGSAKTMITAATTMGAMIPTSLVFNTWITPLIAIAVVCTLLIGTLYKQRGGLYIGVSMLASILTGALIISPISSLLGAKKYANIEGLKMIATCDQATFTPYIGWLIYAGPALIWVLLAWLSTFRQLKYKNILKIVLALGITTAITALAVWLINSYLKNLYEGSTLHLGSDLVPIIIISIPTMLATQYIIAMLSKTKITKQCWLTLLVSIIFSSLYALTETVYLDDYLGEPWERWNTTNKWMPATLFLVTTISAPLALANAKGYTLKTIIYLLIISTTIPAITIRGNDPVKKHKELDFSGARWIKYSPAKPIYEQLLKLEKGVVLEYQHQGLHYNTPGGVMPLLTGHQAYIGWVTAHLELASPNFKVINKRREDAIKFYEGNLNDQGKWADEEGIDYIVWSIGLQQIYNKEDTWVQHPKERRWERAWWINNEKLKDKYLWIETKQRPYREGLWTKKTRLDTN